MLFIRCSPPPPLNAVSTICGTENISELSFTDNAVTTFFAAVRNSVN